MMAVSAHIPQWRRADGVIYRRTEHASILPRPTGTGAGAHRRPGRGGRARLPHGLCRCRPRRGRRGRCAPRAGASLGPLDGVIVSIKDLFDVAGEPTRAGSKILAEEAAPAAVDAVIVRRLRAAGAVLVAKTNMTEFAFSGIGANPHFGTPGNPRDRKRVPGGSSAGAPVAVADGMCEIAIGSDTGGSVRVPAALCGLVGFKPSRQRVPTDGVFR